MPTLDIQSDENLNQIVRNSNTHICGSLVYDDLTCDDIDSMSNDNHAGQLHVDSDDVTLDISYATPSQLISKRCYSFYRPYKDGGLSQAICPGVELNL